MCCILTGNIVAVDNVISTSISNLLYQLGDPFPGQLVDVGILRDDSENLTVLRSRLAVDPDGKGILANLASRALGFLRFELFEIFE